jgi:hypothetical protein
MRELARHPDNDDYPKPPEATIRRAWVLIDTLFDKNTPSPAVVPSEDAGVEIAWHTRGWDLVISILEEGDWIWARNRTIGENWFRPYTECEDRLQEIVRDLTP